MSGPPMGGGKLRIPSLFPSRLPILLRQDLPGPLTQLQARVKAGEQGKNTDLLNAIESASVTG